MTTPPYMTPNLIDELRAEIQELRERLDNLENRSRGGNRDEKFEAEYEAILEVFRKMPPGFKLSSAAVHDNLDIDIERNAVLTRLNKLERTNKIKRHQVGTAFPTFSLLP